MTQTSTPKFVEEVAIEVMKVDKAIELFQTMAIMNINTRNLTLEVNNIKKILFMGEKEKVMLQEEMDKEKDFQKGYKQNVEIWRKNRVEAEQTNKLFIKKLRDENEELKGQHNIVDVLTPALSLRPRQGLAKVRAKIKAYESHFMFLGVQVSVRECTPTLPSELPLWELESRWTFESSKSNFKGQNPLD